MGRDKDQTVFLDVFNGELEAVIVAAMGIFYGVPNWRFDATFFGKCSFFSHVGTSDELETQVVAEFLGGLNLVGDDFSHSLEVALVSIHDNVFVTNVIPVCHLLSK